MDMLGIEKVVDPVNFMALKINDPVRGNAGWRRDVINETKVLNHRERAIRRRRSNSDGVAPETK
jgi:hypothetical protein